MSTGRTDELRKEAVQIALTSGLSRRQVAECCFDRSFCSLSQEMFELGKDLLNRIEVGAVGRQEAETSMFQYLNGFYNPSYRHSALGGKNPLAIRSPSSLNEQSERLKNATGPTSKSEEKKPL